MAGVFQKKSIKGLFVFLLLMGTQVQASVRSVEIKRENRYSPTRIDNLSIDKGTVFLNNKVSTNPKALAQANELLQIKNLSKNDPCYAGKITVSFSEGSKKSLIQGCAQGPEFGKILSRLYALHRLMDSKESR